MTSVFRISKGEKVGAIVHSVEALEAFARAHGPGRYHVDQHAADAFPGSHAKARAWGCIIHHRDGQLAQEPNPWPS